MFWGCQATRFSRGFSTARRDPGRWGFPLEKKLMWSTHSKIFRVLVLEKSINIGYFARGNLRSDQTNWVSSWGLGMPRNLNRSAINHINLKLQTYSFFFITDWCSLSMFQPVPACSSLFQLFKFQDEIPSISPIYGVALGELPDSLGQRRTFFWPNCVPLIGHIQSTAISENHHMGFGFFCSIYGYFPNGDINLLFCYIYLVV